MLEIALSDRIRWDFTVVEQGFHARYGQLKDQYYRQYQPSGLTDNKRHPPRKISVRNDKFARTAGPRFQPVPGIIDQLGPLSTAGFQLDPAPVPGLPVKVQPVSAFPPGLLKTIY